MFSVSTPTSVARKFRVMTEFALFVCLASYGSEKMKTLIRMEQQTDLVALTKLKGRNATLL